MNNYQTIFAQADDEEKLSFLFDVSVIQDSFSFRCQRRARMLAEKLVEENPNIIVPELFYPRGFSDSVLIEHQKKFLHRWRTDTDFVKSFRKFSLPLCHRGAERLVRETLLLGPNAPLNDAHVKKAVLSACLSLPRQNVGSCFATAPAILIHEEQMDNFIADIYELLTTGRLKRTFGGIEYAVPLALSWGLGDLRKSIFQPNAKIWFSPGLMAACSAVKLLDPALPLEQRVEIQYKKIVPYLEKGQEMNIEELIRAMVTPAKENEAKAIFKAMVDNALLKAWEFTLASYSEVKMEFSRWNLFLSLGLHPEEKGGVGQVLYQAVDEKLRMANQKAQDYQAEYQIAFEQMKASETLMRQASSESDMRRLKAEGQSRYYHMQTCLEMRNRFHEQARQYSLFFSFLVQQYDAKFQEYFQEMYDPEMIEIGRGSYDDSPAGFRLYYKHGRTDPTAWTAIHNADQYIQSLTHFFTATESYITAACATDEERNAVSELTTAVVHHVRSSEFLDLSIARMEARGKKPWSYVSGGTMDTLLKTYYRREGVLSQEGHWVESEVELLTLIIDTLKSLPPAIGDLYLANPDKRMLIHSPTHAFILQPGWPLLRDGWQDTGFTYTWIRDNFLLAAQNFYDRHVLSPEEQRALLERLSLNFEPAAPLSVMEFRQKLPPNPEIDSFLYSALPLIPRRSCQAALHKLLEPAVPKLPSSLPDFLTSHELQNMAKASLATPEAHQIIADRARALGLAPTPLLFGDTNWPNNYFAFVVSPGTRQLELWRVDRTGSVGFPMTNWKPFLNGTDKKPWVIYTNSNEYKS